ncbi:protein mono-ADP-ribosyltransferase PARP12-like [Portunus trituberculatus]|uniref:protein mono-ADP-ribosyltransferase PARP12-like n=1 Tax=Portunus trituberculatus TaxID=210409 RepID=UPI001E1CE5BA|nr:protein mono-ADP-ribosyltransferase PARP12-like [Portunus trituberculatus]
MWTQTEPHLPKENKTKAASGSDLPSHWDDMQPEERSRLVTLATDSDEYKKVVKLLGTSVPPTNVVQVDRIQNPFMWCALQNKIKELTALYKNADSVNVRQLFHGTSDNVVASICNENFDWRLHGTAVGQAYGRGTYFGVDAATSYHYCRPGSNGNKHMFVARVAIGSAVVGNSGMARPPINPNTSMPYESTTNNISNPSMIIKYCKQEYYPEYLLTLK